jgi:hypothetical protein
MIKLTNLLKEIVKEAYEAEHEERMDVLSKVMQDKETLDKELSSWKSNPQQMYKNLDQAEEAEEKAFDKANSMGLVRVYSTVKLSNIAAYGTKSKEEEQSVSTHKAKSLFDGNNVDVVLSGKAKLMSYYTKDVSTNELGDLADDSERKLPITPLNPTQSDWDEALVKNKDVKWDIIYYSPKKFNQQEVESLAKKNNLKAVSVLDQDVPQVIKNSKWINK